MKLVLVLFTLINEHCQHLVLSSFVRGVHVLREALVFELKGQQV